MNAIARASGALLVALGFFIAGCASTDPAQPSRAAEAGEAQPAETDVPAGAEADAEADTDAAAEPGTGAIAEAEPEGLEGTDFGNLVWRFRPGGSVPETLQIGLTDGVASDGPVRYEIGEVVHAELTGDERVDAAVQLTRLDGNAIDDQWYLWIATDDGPVQSTLPVARSSRCGTATHSVTAVEGGVEIHETRRSVADQLVPCSETGTDERTRTVAAVEARNENEWWPVQTAPFPAFGGLCPETTHLDAYPSDHANLYAAPDEAAPSYVPAGVFEIAPWPLYGELFPGWALVGAIEDGLLGCAWAQTA